MSTFSQMLVSWRKAERLTQGQLANLLGVSQQAVSNWERNLDEPSAHAKSEIQRLMARADYLAVDAELISEQSAIRALFDLDGIKLCATSRGFRALWPSMSEMMDEPLVDKLLNEAASLHEDSRLKQGIVRRQIIGVTGISEQHLNFDGDLLLKHRWFVRFRPYGHRMIGDMTFEACLDDRPVGIERVLGSDFVKA